MKKFSGIFKLFLVLLTTLFAYSYNASAAGPVAQEIEKTKLKIWSVPRKDVRSTVMRAGRLEFERFVQLNPDIEFTQASGIKLQGQNAFDAVTMSLAGGTAPDIMYANLRKSTTFIQEGFFRPLEDYFSEEDLKKFHPAILPVIKQKGVDGKEHLYLIPIGSPLIMAMQYRKDIFRASGLDPNKPPKDWDEFYEILKKVHDPSKKVYGWYAGTADVAAWYFSNFIYQAGGRIIKQNEKGEWMAAYNDINPETGENPTLVALEFYKKLFHGEYEKNGKKCKGVVFRGSDVELEKAQSEGSLAFSYGYLDEQKLFPPGTNYDLIAIAPLPGRFKGKGGSEFNSMMFGINSQVKDKKVIDAAVRYIRYMAGFAVPGKYAEDENKKVTMSVLVEEGYGKFLNPKYLKKFGYDALLEDINPEWVKVNEEAFKFANPEPYGKNCDRIYWELAGILDLLQNNPNLDLKAELAKAEQHTNEQMIGTLSKETRSYRTRWVMALVVVIIFMFVYFGFKALKEVKEMVKPTTVNFQRTSPRNHIFAWLFMGVAVGTILLWSYIPLGQGLLMAFQDYKVAGGVTWIGLDNFITLFWQPLFYQAMINTVFFVVLTLSLGFFAPIILALILNEIPVGSLFFRMVYYLPTVTSGIVVLLLWKQFYDISDAGLFNKLLAIVHVPPQTWLQDTKLAMLCVILPGIWGGVGAGSIFYLAALKNVPDELYESASIDGAGIWGKLRHVTYPTLSMLLIINFVGAFIGSFNATGNILVMTAGGPAHATHVIGLEIFYNAFIYLKFGYATAIAWVLGSILLGFTVLQLRILREVRFTSVNKM